MCIMPLYTLSGYISSSILFRLWQPHEGGLWKRMISLVDSIKKIL